MFHQVSRFVSRFRDLEQQDFTNTTEEERQWRLLKEKLTLPDVPEPLETVTRKCIAVTSLYPQAGASFIAGNVAYAWAAKGIPVTLCELPNHTSYFYFALDYERRVRSFKNLSPTSLILMQNNQLRIQIETPSHVHPESSQIDIASWILRLNKESSIVFIDVSSNWNKHEAKQIFELADEIWVILDADIARLTRLFLIESVPGWWISGKNKVKIIANKWNAQLARTTVLKKVEGTLSLWGTSSPQVDYQVPLIDQEKAAAAHVKANFLLELFPEEESEFQSLMYVHKGRML
ncbi:hypothetical protein AV540_08025 [Brevibacillus parabrevis]|uniref:hypothetical protein n=1 Tax=Brevibacillus parabrevis TaxID=54914 RepID=UPI0007ABEED7|nr:hypothetical protein [Brevibacillus parabrevis]KZE53558.1 hypothetical protein AV540_08025 [Brevibacillus parabrevis]